MSGNCFQHCHLLLRAIQISWRAQTIIELTTPLAFRLPVPIDDLLHISLCSMHYFRLINCLINARLLQVLWVLRVNILHQQQQKLNTFCLKLRRTDRETGKQRDRRTDIPRDWWMDRQRDEWRQTDILSDCPDKRIIIIINTGERHPHYFSTLRCACCTKIKGERQTCLNTLLFILFVCFLLLLCFLFIIFVNYSHWTVWKSHSLN